MNHATCSALVPCVAQMKLGREDCHRCWGIGRPGHLWCMSRRMQQNISQVHSHVDCTTQPATPVCGCLMTGLLMVRSAAAALSSDEPRRHPDSSGRCLGAAWCVSKRVWEQLPCTQQPFSTLTSGQPASCSATTAQSAAATPCGAGAHTTQHEPCAAGAHHIRCAGHC